ncbi:MAG TPA: hypothetical protein VHL08_10105 [Dongiaceae bacterium]|jgi:hypothetical protein|nr:hypothetical protein [Dongiaceae bacterium]
MRRDIHPLEQPTLADAYHAEIARLSGEVYGAAQKMALSGIQGMLAMARCESGNARDAQRLADATVSRAEMLQKEVERFFSDCHG